MTPGDMDLGPGEGSLMARSIGRECFALAMLGLVAPSSPPRRPADAIVGELQKVIMESRRLRPSRSKRTIMEDLPLLSLWKVRSDGKPKASRAVTAGLTTPIALHNDGPGPRAIQRR